MSSSRRHPFYTFAVPAVAASAALAVGLCVWLGGPLWLWWLLAVNVVAFAAYGWDKRASSRQTRRIPEAVLLGLAALGGTVGALAGMAHFRHKTRKRGFLALFWLIAALQIGAVAWRFW